jgi:hypothetical protein
LPKERITCVIPEKIRAIRDSSVLAEWVSRNWGPGATFVNRGPWDAVEIWPTEPPNLDEVIKASNLLIADVNERLLKETMNRDYRTELFTGTPGGELRVIDPITGGEKGSKLARFDLIPQDVLWMLAEHYGRGAQKYEDRNWERGYKWSLSYAALMRHLSAFWQGEDTDAETGSPHIIAAVWHAMALAAFQERAIGTDDRGSHG